MPKISKGDARTYERRGYPGHLRKRTRRCWKWMPVDDDPTNLKPTSPLDIE